MWDGFNLRRLTVYIQKRRVSTTQCNPVTGKLTSCWQQGEKMSVAEWKGTSEASDFMV